MWYYYEIFLDFLQLGFAHLLLACHLIRISSMAKSKQKTVNFMPELLVIFALLVVVWAVGVGFYHGVEKLAFVDAVYLSAMTLTTVGYGDFTPQTDAGKIFTSVYAFLGIAVFFGFAGMFFAATLSRIQKRTQ
jgi:ion channel